MSEMSNNSNDSFIFNVWQNIRQNNTFDFIYRILLSGFQLWISSLAILWSAVFIYLVFYYSYIPLVSTSKEVYIQYDSKCDPTVRDNTCQNPTARVALRQGRTNEFLMGQMYKFTIDLHLPESEVNWNQGLFMIRLRLLDQKRQIGTEVAKPTGLKYKSFPLRMIITLLYWPLFVVGLADEKQTISVSLIEDFIEGSNPRVGPITDAIIEFEARDVQIYPPTVLRVSAQLTGLRYFMYNHSFTSFLVGTTTIAFFLYIMTAIGFANYYLVRNFSQNNHNSDENQLNEELNEELNKEINEMNDVFNEDLNIGLDDEISRVITDDLIDETHALNVRQNQSMDEITEESDKLLSGLTGDMWPDSTESEGSSTLVIPEADDIDNGVEDMD